jgi:hypothetical protein
MTANVEWDARMAADASTVTHTQIPGDDYAGELPLRIDPAAIKRLSQLRPFVSSAHIAVEWALIMGAAWLCWHFWHPALYVLTVAFVGSEAARTDRPRARSCALAPVPQTGCQ